MPARRAVLFNMLACAGLLATAPQKALCAIELLVPNMTGLYAVSVARVVTPSTSEDVSRAVRDWPGKIAVGGGRYSMGGQIAISGGLHLDMRGMNRLIWLDAQKRLARVQAGMRWRDLQDIIDPVGLAVHTMQSYANFTVGGSVSVNAHGRYVGNGPVGNSVKALQLVLADGSVVEASRSDHVELFRAALGGYGAVAIITEVELDLSDNARIERIVKEMPLDDYPSFHETLIKGDKNCVLHNADLMPPAFDTPVAVSWRKTTKALTEQARLIPRGQTYAMEQNVLWALTELPGGAQLRKSVVHPLRFSGPAVKWLNHEASRDVAELEPRTRKVSTYALQEYFVPVRHFANFARGLSGILRQRRVEAVNVSVRHSPADNLSLVAWAKEEVFSFVLYYKQRTSMQAQNEVGKWTRELIDLALKHEGRYYLPYQLHATKEQFGRAYPEAGQLRELKRKADPNGKFSNELWAKYL
ncbi:MAG: FAD-binding oxidoreductase [Noviherbaspirillum sp.]